MLTSVFFFTQEIQNQINVLKDQEMLEANKISEDQEMLDLDEIIRWIARERTLNTKKAYATYANQYLAYAAINDEIAVPGTPLLIANFLRNFHVHSNLTVSTITKNAFYAVADIHRFTDEKAHNDPLVKATCKILKKLAKRNKRGKTPILAEILLNLLRTLDLTDEEDLQYATILVLS